MPQQITTTSDIVLESDAWFCESAFRTPELSFSSDSASSDGGSPSPSSDQFSLGYTFPRGWDLFAEPIDLELLSEHPSLQQYSSPDPPLIFSQLPPSLTLDPTTTHFPPRKLRKRPPLHQLNITSVPFPPPNILTDTPLLGSWRRYDTPVDSASSSPSRVADKKLPWQLPTPLADADENIVPQSSSPTCPAGLHQICCSPSPHSSRLRLATTEDALVSLVLAGELPLSRVQTISAVQPQNVPSPGDADLRRSNSLIPLVHSSEIPDSCVPFPLMRDIPNGLNTRSRAAFISQELARTERRYLSSLRMSFNAGSADPLSSAVSVYLPPLVEVSEKLLAALEQDLSATGVAMSFLSLETKLQASFTSWCGAFRCLFVSDNENKRRLRVDSGPELPRRRADSWGLRTIKRLKAWKVPAMDLSRRKPHSRSKSTSHILTHSGSVLVTEPSLRDLALSPIQRVTDYRRFFEDLYSHVAPFESHIVQRAMMAAIAISESCDRAQGNAAFLTS